MHGEEYSDEAEAALLANTEEEQRTGVQSVGGVAVLGESVRRRHEAIEPLASAIWGTVARQVIADQEARGREADRLRSQTARNSSTESSPAEPSTSIDGPATSLL